MSARETKRRAVTYIVTLQCDCGGEMFPSGIVRDSHPPMHCHACNGCFAEGWYGHRYPRQIVEVEND